MARNRMIKVDFWSDEKIAKVSPISRLLFIGIWNFCDDSGVCRATPGFLRSQIFQHDDISLETVKKLLAELSSNSLILLAEYNSESFLLVKNFHKHQKIDKPSKNRFIQMDDCKVLELFNSSSTRGVVDDDSVMNIKEKVKVKEKDISPNESASAVESVEKENEINLEKISKIWNNMAEQCGLPKTKLSPLLADKLKKRFNEARKAFPSVEDWQRIVEAVPYDNFRLGQNERKWRPDFAWLFQDHGSKKIPNYICLMTEWDFQHEGE